MGAGSKSTRLHTPTRQLACWDCMCNNRRETNTDTGASKHVKNHFIDTYSRLLRKLEEEGASWGVYYNTRVSVLAREARSRSIN